MVRMDKQQYKKLPKEEDSDDEDFDDEEDDLDSAVDEEIPQQRQTVPIPVNNPKQIQQKQIFVPRCVCEADMFNIINDKLDLIVSKLK